jgi:phosphotransferase system HPr (HPr) family protein
MKQNFTQIIATIKNQRGIHVGPTGLIVGYANKVENGIKIIWDGIAVDAKSMMGLMLL